MKATKERTYANTEKYLKEFDDSLSGKTFTLAMDDGEDYCVSFLTATEAVWAKVGEPLRTEKYACLEVDEATYFVNCELAEAEVRTCISLVLDTRQSLVTALIAKMGCYPKRPRLVTNQFLFGAIRVDGQPLPIKRHSFTADLVGGQMTWTYPTGFINTHLYIDANYYRIRPLQMAYNAEPQADEPLFEEPCRYVKISDNIYMISFIEDNLNKRDPLRGGNNLLVVINVKEKFDVGRTFAKDAQQQNDGGVFVTYGEPTDEYIELAHSPSIYRE